MPINFTRELIEALLEALVLGEKVKPSQAAKREVFRKYGILGTAVDRVFTAVIYRIHRMLGVLDKELKEAGFEAESEAPLVKWLLRLYTYLVHHDPLNDIRFREAVRKYGLEIIRERLGAERAYQVENVMRKVENVRYVPKTPEEELELKYNVSSWLIKRLIQLLGPEETERFLQAANEKPSLGLRVNTLKGVKPEDVLEELKRHGAEAWISPYVPTVVKFKGTVMYDELDVIRKGGAIPQDDSSALASLLLEPRPGEVIVDLCAAPGGKTTHLAELTGDKGWVIALELNGERAEYLKNVVRRYGVEHIVDIMRADGRIASKILGEEIADKVLVDPPCTTTGVIAKHGEARWRLSEDKLMKIVENQKALLREGVRLLRKGGRLLYCVCSILPEEGEEVVRAILEEFKGELMLVELRGPFDPSPWLPGTMRAWPHRHNTTGFFYALLERV